MKHNEIVQGVVKRKKKNEYRSQIESFLRSQNIATEDREAIYEEANEIIFQEKMQKLPIRNKVLFAMFLGLTILSILLIFMWLPYLGLYSISTLIIIISSGIVLLFSVLTIGFFKSWLPQRIKNESSMRGVLLLGFAIIIIPIVVLAFFISNRFDNVKSEELTQNAVLCSGYIGSGYSISSKRFDFTSLQIKFKTKDGKVKSVEYSVPKYEFKKYVDGQKVLMEYSSKHTDNIRLIMNQENIAEKFGSQERMPIITDLMDLLESSRNHNKIVRKLDKIIFGWYYIKKEKAFVNKRYDLKFSKTRDEIMLTSRQEAMRDFVKELKMMGFESWKGKRIFRKSGNQYVSEENSMYAVFGLRRGKMNYNDIYSMRNIYYFGLKKKIE